MLSAKIFRNPTKYPFIHLCNQKVSHCFSVVLVLTFFCSFSFQCVPGAAKEVIQVFEGSSVIDARILPVS